MKALMKLTTGAAAAALLSAAAASPAQAQYYERDRGVSAGEIIAGVAAVAGVVAIASAASRDRYGHGYGYDRYGYDRGFERHAVNACQYEADRRYARRGDVRFHVSDVQRFRDRVRVLGAVDVRDYRRNVGWDRRGVAQRVAVTCEVRTNGRIASFRTHNYRW
ncbi:MAG: hypothetical protein ACK4K7_04650 [Allosphingosinicella sp.]|uniref:hypothetical protein n=1 Tax=Allosphingosinicella sp. TaxID=2823234 RepID=UPI0039627A6F